MTERTSERIWRAARAAYESRGQLKTFLPWDDLRQVSRDIEYDAMVAAFEAVDALWIAIAGGGEGETAGDGGKVGLRERIAELEVAGDDARACVNMLLLCGEDGGKRQDEKPAAYLRRLIDALIKAEARVRFLEGRIDAAVVELQRVRAERTEKANARIAELEAEVRRLQNNEVNDCDLLGMHERRIAELEAVAKTLPLAVIARLIEQSDAAQGDVPGWAAHLLANMTAALRIETQRITELGAERNAMMKCVIEVKAERDAIRAKTFEECATVVERMPIQIYGPDSCKPATFDDAAAAIRALAQTDEASQKERR